MSALVEEEGVEVVKFSFKKKDCSSTSVYYVAQDYYRADELASGSPEAWPVLAGSPSPIRIQMSEFAFGLRGSATVRVYGRSHFDGYGRGFVDIAETHTLHGGTAEFYFYARAFDAQASSTAKSLRQTLEVESVSYDQDSDIFELRCVETWWKEKPIGRIINSADFSNFLDIEQGRSGDYAPIVFGSNVIIETPRIDVGPLFLHAGWGYSGSYYPDDVSKIYVRAPAKASYRGEYLLLDTDVDGGVSESTVTGFGGFAGYWNASLDGWGSLAAQWYALSNVFTYNHLLYAVRIYARSQGTIADDTGELRVAIYEAESQGSSIVLSTTPIARQTYDATTISGTGQDVVFAFDDPAMLVAGVRYAFVAEWSNADDTTNRIDIAVKNVAGCFRRDRSVREAGYTLFNSAIPFFELYDIYKTTETDKTDNFATPTAYYHELQLGTHSNVGDPGGFNLRFKCEVDGLADDGSGTYTGSAGALIRTPADVLRFALLNDEFGLGLGPGAINAASFNTLRNAENTLGEYLAFVLDYPISVTELARQIALHGRFFLYKNRSAELEVHAPSYSSTPDHVLTEQRLRSDLQVIDQRDKPHSSIVTVVKSGYNPERLNFTDETRRARLLEGERLEGKVCLDENDELGRGPASEEAQFLYGRREMTVPFTFFDAEADARRSAEYYFDRNSKSQRIVEVRLPRVDYYDVIEVFDVVRVEHSVLYADSGTPQDVQFQNEGSVCAVFRDNVVYDVVRNGAVWGEVVGVRESGAFVDIIVETVSGY